jgi:hypothetical protein
MHPRSIEMQPIRLFAPLLALLLALPAQAAEVNVAVAANFTAPMKVIAAEVREGHRAQGESVVRFHRQVLRPDQERRAVPGHAVGG